MENIERQKILDTIYKLSQIANPDNNAFANEMAVAATAMQRLMDKYSISPEEIFSIQNKEIDNFFEKQTDCMFGRISRWEWWLAQIISKITHTKHYSQSIYAEKGKETIKGDIRFYGKTIGFWGRETNVASACSLFQLWLVQINVMASIATSDHCRTLLKLYNAEAGHHIYNNAYSIPNLGSSHPNIFKTSWLEGCMSAISRSLSAEEAERSDKTSMALAIYDKNLQEEWEKHSSHFRKNKVRDNSRINMTGYLQGLSDGSNIHINQKNLKEQ